MGNGGPPWAACCSLHGSPLYQQPRARDGYTALWSGSPSLPPSRPFPILSAIRVSEQEPDFHGGRVWVDVPQKRAKSGFA